MKTNLGKQRYIKFRQIIGAILLLFLISTLFYPFGWQTTNSSEFDHNWLFLYVTIPIFLIWLIVTIMSKILMITNAENNVFAIPSILTWLAWMLLIFFLPNPSEPTTFSFFQSTYIGLLVFGPVCVDFFDLDVFKIL